MLTFDTRTWEPSERRVRGSLGGAVVVDSGAALLVREAGRPYVTYAFPRRDVRTDLVPDALRTYDGDPDLADYVSVRWSALDHWYEEDEERLVGPQDPYHRVDAVRSTRHVRVAIDGQVVAESRRPLAVFETGLPAQFYLPPEDVRLELFEPTATRTGCPYKGYASYRTYRGEGTPERADVAWSYEEPLPEAAPLAGYVAFYDSVADVVVDGGESADDRYPGAVAAAEHAFALLENGLRRLPRTRRRRGGRTG
ncbi:DUF427 domain-containing protein [Streptomyces sp. B22F1]|uniref:DUF427 domain-containing protein n=1 Tax=Streptomyces sp. B22F1 TaxID=3153566 RepID=UPI00325D5854